MTHSMNANTTCGAIDEMDFQLPSKPRSFSFRTHDWLKPKVDFSVALILFAFAIPVIALLGLLVKFTSPGPLLYSQSRVGRSGRVFRIYKIRSMHHNCELTSGARWSTGQDPRITIVGRILRKTHLDELPQLWNILRGDMSLVGPRPERPEFTTVLEKAVERYRDRQAVKPGITGLAQIQLPPDSSLSSVRDKLALDLVYIDRRSLWLDLRLILGTAIYLVGGSFSLVAKLMFLPRFSIVPGLIATDENLNSPALAILPRSAPEAELRTEPQFSAL